MPDWFGRATRFIRLSILLHVAAVVTVVAAPRLWYWALGTVLLNHLFITAAGLWPRSHWLGPNWIRLPQHASTRNEIALTIDDGPDPAVTPQVLDLLDLHGVKATFFCIGIQAQRYPGLCREIVRRGHAVENHSQHHRHYFSLMGPKSLERELRAAQATLTAICGQSPMFFRAPAGLRNPFLEPVLFRLGLRLATWSVRGFDTRVKDPAQVAKALAGGVKPGAILLLHDGHAAHTEGGTPVILKVLPELLDLIKAKGLSSVTLRKALA